MVFPLDPEEAIHWHRREILQPPLSQIPSLSTSIPNSLDLRERSVILRRVDSEANGQGTVIFGGGFGGAGAGGGKGEVS